MTTIIQRGCKGGEVFLRGNRGGNLSKATGMREKAGTFQKSRGAHGQGLEAKCTRNEGSVVVHGCGPARKREARRGDGTEVNASIKSKGAKEGEKKMTNWRAVPHAGLKGGERSVQ